MNFYEKRIVLKVQSFFFIMHKSLFYLGAATLLATAIVSCNGKPDFLGTWSETAPTQNSYPFGVDGTEIVNCQSTTSAVFLPNENAKITNSGPVKLSVIYELGLDSMQLTAANFSYAEHVAATATIAGKWIADGDKWEEDDDLILVLDYNSLDVNIDKNTVSFSQNVLSGMQQPQIDSLSNVAVARFKDFVTKRATMHFTNLSKLDDVKIKAHGQILKFETEGNNIQNDIIMNRVQ